MPGVAPNSDFGCGFGAAWHHKECFFQRSVDEGWGVTSYRQFSGHVAIKPRDIADICVITGEAAPGAGAGAGAGKAKKESKKKGKKVGVLLSYVLPCPVVFCSGCLTLSHQL